MPAVHTIDHDQKVIITTWEGEPTTQDLADAFKKYQLEIREDPQHISFNELVDFSGIKGISLNSNGLRILADIAAKSDITQVKTKLAIVVKPGLTFGFARMYEIYRNLNPKKSKEIKVFQDSTPALAWLKNE